MFEEKTKNLEEKIKETSKKTMNGGHLDPLIKKLKSYAKEKDNKRKIAKLIDIEEYVDQKEEYEYIRDNYPDIYKFITYIPKKYL